MRRKRRKKTRPDRPKEVNLRKSVIRWGIAFGVIAAIALPTYWFGVRRALLNSKVRSLLHVYVDENQPQADRDNAKNDLLELGRKAVPALARELLRNEELTYEDKQSTALLLGEIRDTRAVTSLIVSVIADKPHEDAVKTLEVYSPLKEEGTKAQETLREFNDYSRCVADVLGGLNHPKTVAILKAKMKAKKDPSDHVRRFELRVMGAMKDTGSVGELTGILRNGGQPEEVRAEAAKSLGMIGDRDAVEPLIEALKSRQAQVQLQAAISLGYLSDPRAVRPLIQLLEQPALAKSRGLDQNIIYSLVRIRSNESQAYLYSIENSPGASQDVKDMIEAAKNDFSSGMAN